MYIPFYAFLDITHNIGIKYQPTCNLVMCNIQVVIFELNKYLFVIFQISIDYY